MACAWCDGPIPKGARRDSVFCSKRCRQAAFRLRERRTELAERPARALVPLRMAYADPPYPGLARRYYSGEASYAGEVDHVALIAELAGFDGWALSTGSFALRELLPLCPDGARVCSWAKPVNPSPSTYGPHGAWEPLIVVPGRRLRPGKRDWIVAAPARLGGSILAGRKPLAFVAWMFDMLGLLPGDELVDLFPGSGIVSRAWREACREDVAAVPLATRRREQLHDASPTPAARRLDPSRAAAPRHVAEVLGATRPPAPARDVSPRAIARRLDPSRLGRRRRAPLGVAAERESK